MVLDVICMFTGHVRIKKENIEANAKLISLAPDMKNLLIRISKCKRTEPLPSEIAIEMMKIILELEKTK